MSFIRVAYRMHPDIPADAVEAARQDLCLVMDVRGYAHGWMRPNELRCEKMNSDVIRDAENALEQVPNLWYLQEIHIHLSDAVIPRPRTMEGEASLCKGPFEFLRHGITVRVLCMPEDRTILISSELPQEVPLIDQRMGFMGGLHEIFTIAGATKSLLDLLQASQSRNPKRVRRFGSEVMEKLGALIS